MAHNPLLGARISLISKKNIRYEGTLYSINESDATVALQNVLAYGTEGRELEPDANFSFVPPQDQLHPYLLFRGCDIKDLHVHESPAAAAAALGAKTKEDPPADPGTLSSDKPPEVEDAVDDDEINDGGNDNANANAEEPAASASVEASSAKTQETQKQAGGKNKSISESKSNARPASSASELEAASNANANGGANGSANGSAHAHTSDSKPKKNQQQENESKPRRRKNNAKQSMVGSGASLLNRKARGVVEDANGPDMNQDFDFQSNLAEFTKTEDDDSSDSNSEEEDNSTSGGYSKDDFFDSISSDAQDRQSGNNNRLRGKEERSMNTETFGATSLGNNRRYRKGRGGGGRGRGRGGGAYGESGSGRGRGRGRGGRGRGRGNGNGNGIRRQYGDGMPNSSGGNGGGGGSNDGNWRTVN